MNQIIEHFIPYHNQRIYCLQKTGAPEQVPLLLIHGIGSDLSTYLEAFSDKRFNQTIYALDLPGHGKSDTDCDFSFSMAEYAALIKHLVTHFGIRKVNVIAHSMGGVIAILMAMANPEIVNQLILAEAIINPLHAKMSQSIEAYGDERNFAKNYHQFLERFNRPDKKVAYHYYQTLVKCPAYVIFRSAKSLLSVIQPPFYNRFLNMPVSRHYFLGQKSYYTLSQVEREDFCTHGISICEISGAGHNMMFENPDEFYTQVGKIIHEH